MSLAAVTQTYRQTQLALRARTARDTIRLWPLLNGSDDSTLPEWMAAVLGVLERDRETAIGLATAYVSRAAVEQGIDGPAVVRAGALDLAQATTSLRVTSLIAYRIARRAGQPSRLASQTALVRSTGTVTRLVIDAGRDTVRESLRADQRAAGWRRITSAKACGFCQMLAGRGGVYSADTADFESHDHCACIAEPVWRT